MRGMETDKHGTATKKIKRMRSNFKISILCTQGPDKFSMSEVAL